MDDVWGPRDKALKTPALERGFLYQQADTLLVETCAAGKDLFFFFFTIFVEADKTIKLSGQIYKWALLCG